MHRTLPARWLNRTLRLGDIQPSNSVPLFLCPSLAGAGVGHVSIQRPRTLASQSRVATPRRSQRFLHTEIHPKDATTPYEPVLPAQKSDDTSERKLPTNCSGCGAFTQTNDASQLGYFDMTSKRVRKWFKSGDRKTELEATKEDNVVSEALSSLDASQLRALGLDPASLSLTAEAPTPQPGTVPSYLSQQS